jgi:hypothetical protein
MRSARVSAALVFVFVVVAATLAFVVAPVVHAIGTEPSTTLASVSSGTINTGAQFTMIATISPHEGGGTVLFSIDGFPAGEATVNPNGRATRVATARNEGTHVLRAQFGGNDTLFWSEGSATFEVIEHRDPVLVTLSSGINPGHRGESIPFLVAVDPAPSSGQVILIQGSSSSDWTALDVDGKAVIPMAFGIPGSYSITACFQGNAVLADGCSGPVVQEIFVLDTVTTLDVSPSFIHVGESLAWTVTVDPPPEVAVRAVIQGIGLEIWVQPGTGIGQRTTTAAEAPFQSSYGTHDLVAHYPGSNWTEPSDSSIATVVVGRDPTVTTLTIEPAVVEAPTSVVASVVVEPPPPQGVTVGFTVHGVPGGDLFLYDAFNDASSGVASVTFPIGLWPVGTYQVTAVTDDSIYLAGSTDAGAIKVVDVTPPIGTATIESGNNLTTSRAVYVQAPASDGPREVTDVALSNDGASWTIKPYISWNTDVGWLLSDGDGLKTVRVKWRDGAGNWSAVKTDTIILDSTAPAGTTSIADGAAYTVTSSITVSVPATDGLSGMSRVALSNDGAAWTEKPYAAEVAWSLGTAQGTRVVHVKWRDVAGTWSAVKSDTIVFDSLAPTGAVSIASGASYAKSTGVSLSMTATDASSGVSQVALSNDGTNWTTRTYAASQAWTLPATNGTRTVYVKWRDGAGNWSAVKSDTIVLDTVAPTAAAPVRALLSSTAISAGRIMTRLSWSGSDATSGFARYELQQSTDSGAWSTVSTSLTSAILDRLLATQHTYTFRVRAIDQAGNAGAWMAGPTAVLSRYDETSPSIGYSGTWRRTFSSVFWSGAAKMSSTAGSKATFTFTGRSVAFVSRLGPTKGKARIYVDGTLVATADLYASTYKSQRVVWARNWATGGNHSVSIVVSGSIGRPRIDVDAFVRGG